MHEAYRPVEQFNLSLGKGNATILSPDHLRRDDPMIG
jgi:hypothetical protein